MKMKINKECLETTDFANTDIVLKKTTLYYNYKRGTTKAITRLQCKKRHVIKKRLEVYLIGGDLDFDNVRLVRALIYTTTCKNMPKRFHPYKVLFLC